MPHFESAIAAARTIYRVAAAEQSLAGKLVSVATAILLLVGLAV
jgi:hypothetical protein